MQFVVKRFGKMKAGNQVGNGMIEERCILGGIDGFRLALYRLQ
jgi:hypothetical protein